MSRRTNESEDFSVLRPDPAMLALSYLVKQKSKKKGTRKKQETGSDLFHQVVRLTGIPKTALLKELRGILEKQRIDVKDLTLDQLRMATASYLREIMGGLLDKVHSRRHDQLH